MYKVLLRRPYGKIYQELATFQEKWYAEKFIETMQRKLYGVLSIEKNK